MDDDLLDLVPLFLSEARERLARLRELTAKLESARPALLEARRELHTLKGSSRMLKLAAIGDLCHQGEELLDVVTPGAGLRVLAIAERIGVLLDAVPLATAVLPGGAPHVLHPPAERLRVLLVEDSFTHREMERRLLEEEGFEVLAVAGADAALDALGEQLFDCLVTDIEMPGMNGLELTRRLRAAAAFAALPIVIVSTLDAPADREAGLLAGADAYLSKAELNGDAVGAIIRSLRGAR